MAPNLLLKGFAQIEQQKLVQQPVHDLDEGVVTTIPTVLSPTTGGFDPVLLCIL